MFLTDEPWDPHDSALWINDDPQISGDPADSADVPSFPRGLHRHDGGAASGRHHWMSEREASGSTE